MSTQSTKLLLIDGNSILYRAFFALPPLSNRSGQQTNAVYGFTLMLLKLLQEEKPTHLAVAFDKSKKPFDMSCMHSTRGLVKRPPANSLSSFLWFERYSPHFLFP
ncbi:hypothetical protein GCM10025859_52820 [Alicyclobacillus fastidiosus]|nr:hypothetical protein GCM10025859_52820 [Alicyclobacillus fastidiosus]